LGKLIRFYILTVDIFLTFKSAFLPKKISTALIERMGVEKVQFRIPPNVLPKDLQFTVSGNNEQAVNDFVNRMNNPSIFDEDYAPFFHIEFEDDNPETRFNKFNKIRKPSMYDVLDLHFKYWYHFATFLKR
jgi:hypothetical protein